MVVVFKSRLLQVRSVDDDEVVVKWSMERYIRRSGDAQPYASGLSMSNDEDVWPRQLRQVGGLRLVGARTMLGKSVGVEVEVDLNVAAQLYGLMTILFDTRNNKTT